MHVRSIYNLKWKHVRRHVLDQSWTRHSDKELRLNVTRYISNRKRTIVSEQAHCGLVKAAYTYYVSGAGMIMEKRPKPICEQVPACTTYVQLDSHTAHARKRYRRTPESDNGAPLSRRSQIEALRSRLTAKASTGLPRKRRAPKGHIQWPPSPTTT